MRNVGHVGLHLHVDSGLTALADRLAERLAEVPSDPFTPELVVVPGDGVRSWLNHALAHRLGITANIRFIYPARLVAEVLGPDADLGRWGVDPLTWVIHSLLAEDGAADALRARAIADLFDRYTLYRAHMVRAWSSGSDVNGVLEDLADHHRWQPALWRRVHERVGGPTDAERMRTLVDELRIHGADRLSELPDRVSVFGISSFPHPYLEVLSALSAHTDVAIFAPINSPARWEQVRLRSSDPLRHPTPRDEVATSPAAHRLNRAWARSSEEGHLLLLDTIRDATGTVTPPAEPPSNVADSLLHRVQRGIANDAAPDGSASLDGSVVWHRTFGPTRQVEVIRDHLLHLLDTDGMEPALEPRDIVVLTPDVERFAPIVESVFAGDPDNGLPAIPVQVADRSLGAENPIAIAGLALIDLLDGRFRISDVLALAALPVVSARFGLTADDVDRISTLLVEANARWGLDAESHVEAGVPVLGAFTLGDALDRLMVGALTGSGGPELGIGDVAASKNALFDDLSALGSAMALLATLRAVERDLTQSLPPAEWAERFLLALHDIAEVEPDRGFLWRSVDHVITQVTKSASLVRSATGDVPVDPAEMVALIGSRLSAGAGRPRFDSGRVTLSSLTALRGVPHRVVCLIGLDLDTEPSGFGSPDDLVAASPCVGDRDARSEYRSQILDAVMAASERLVISSTGFDLRSRAEVAPAVALSELIDTIGELIGDEFSPIDHPRQAWSEPAFERRPTIGDHPWSHDAGAAAAAEARRHQTIEGPGVPILNPGLAPDEVHLSDLTRALIAPVRAFCEGRLGVYLHDLGDDVLDPRIPFSLGGLDKYALRDQMLTAALDDIDPATWMAYLSAGGDIPPGGYGTAVIEEVTAEVESIVDLIRADGFTTPLERSTVAVSLPAEGTRPRIVGEVAGVVGSTIIDARASSYRPGHLLERITELALLHLESPDDGWAAILYRNGKSKADRARVQVALRDPEMAAEVLDIVLGHQQTAMTTPVAFFPELAEHLAEGRTSKASDAWKGSDHRPGEREKPWNRLFYDHSFDELSRVVDLGTPVQSIWTRLMDAVVIDDGMGVEQ